MKEERFTDIRMEYIGKVARIRICRPERLNAIRINTYSELITALKEADNSPECHVIMLEGEGGQFTAGNDLADLAGGGSAQLLEAVQGIFDCVSGLNKVLIAAVEGVAVGIGTTVLLHCDIAIASSQARFRLPFSNLGVCPEGGSSVLLPQAIGEKVARELLLTGRFFSAEEALSWGLLNAIAEPGKAAEVAEEYIETLLQQPLASLIATKKLMQGSRGDVSGLVASELRAFVSLLEQEETQQRIGMLLQR